MMRVRESKDSWLAKLLGCDFVILPIFGVLYAAAKPRVLHRAQALEKIFNRKRLGLIGSSLRPMPSITASQIERIDSIAEIFPQLLEPIP